MNKMKYFKINIKNKKILLKYKNLFDGNLVFELKKFHKKTYRTERDPLVVKFYLNLKKLSVLKTKPKFLKDIGKMLKNALYAKVKKRNYLLKDLFKNIRM